MPRDYQCVSVLQYRREAEEGGGRTPRGRKATCAAGRGLLRRLTVTTSGSGWVQVVGGKASGLTRSATSTTTDRCGTTTVSVAKGSVRVTDAKRGRTTVVGRGHRYRTAAGEARSDVYWDGKRVKSYKVCDGLAPQYLIFNVGTKESRKMVYGPASQVKVDWVRVWARG